MKLVFEGKVEEGDPYRCDYDPTGGPELHGAVFIGETDVVDAILSAKFEKPVTVAIADERFAGPVTGDFGWGYSEYTPMDPDTLSVGPHDLISILKRFDGQEVRVVVADEATNFLSDDTSGDDA